MGPIKHSDDFVLACSQMFLDIFRSPVQSTKYKGRTYVLPLVSAFYRATGSPNTGEIDEFQPISRHVPETAQDRDTVTRQGYYRI